MGQVVDVSFNQQQDEVLARLRSHLGASLSDEELVASAFESFVNGEPVEDGDGQRKPGAIAGEGSPTPLEYGALRDECVLEPVSGVAVPLRAGEVIRIIQAEDGGQCVDLNAFNLHDYKEYLSVGRTRAYNGLFPSQGGLIYTNSPRDRVMFEIRAMAESCRAETIGARCNAVLFERALGLDSHTNCQDTLAECIGAYGLTPDDVHDSFNLWMNTEVDPSGHTFLAENTGKVGDYVDLLAVFDTLCVPIVCGSGDVFKTSNFRLKRIKVEVYAPSDATLSRAEALDVQYNRYKNNRTPKDFRADRIRADRKLEKVPDYTPNFLQFPLRYREIPVALTDAQYEHVVRLREDDGTSGQSDADVVRACVMKLYLRVAARLNADVESVFAGSGPGSPEVDERGL